MHTVVLLLIQALVPPGVSGPGTATADPGSCHQAPPAPLVAGSSPETTLRSTFVRLPDGTRLRVVEAGQASGEALVVLHGYSDSWFSFSRILPLLADRFRVIAPDLRGHGCSDRPGGSYAMEVLADDVADLMEALDIGRASVLGHSMGGLVAQHLAARHPARVERLVLAGSGLGFAGVPAAVELAEAVETLADPVPVDFVREFQVSTFHRPLPAAFVDAVIAESMRLPAGTWQALMHGMLSAEPAAPRLATGGVPILLLWGELDSVFGPVERRALRQALPDAAALEYENVGHAPHWETPDRFAADLRAFLAGAGSVRP